MKVNYFKDISKMIKRKYAIVLSVVLSVFLVFSCMKDDFDMTRIASGQYSPNVAVPLIHSELTLGDLLRDQDGEHIAVEPGTNLITLVYQGRVFSQLASDIFVIPNQSFSNTENLNIPGFPPGIDSVTLNLDQVFTFASQNGGIYDSIILKTCDLNLQISLDLNQNAKFRFTIPNATRNGVPYYKEIPYNYNSGAGLPVLLNNDIDLSGYKIAFNNGAVDNELTVQIEMVVYNTNAVLPAYSIGFSQNFSNIKYWRLYGYLGQQTFNLAADTFSIDVYKNSFSGHMLFEDPKIKILVSNSMGMPIDLTFNTLTALSPVNMPYVLPITGSGIPNPFSIPSPSINSLNTFAKDSIYLTAANSNFPAALNMAPREIAFAINGAYNPSGIPVQNYIMDNSKFNVDLDVELPLYGRAFDFVLQDTMDFGFDAIDQIDWVSFKIKVENWFPIDAQVQVFFADSNSVLLDSLISPLQSIIEAGVPTTTPFKVTTPTTKATEIMLTNAKLRKLYACKKMIVRGVVETTNQGNDNVKIFTDSKLDVKIGTRVQGKLNYNLQQ